MKAYQHRIAVIVAAVWVIVLPFVWARLYSWAVVCPYAEILPRYRPDLAIGVAAAVLLPGAWMRKRWAEAGLIAAALLLPILKVTFTGPMPGMWVISTLLLLLAAWGTHFAIDAPSPDMKRLALRVLLTPVYGFAAIGTPPVYLHLVAGAFAGLEGIAAGKYSLGALLCTLSLLALFALWRVWSIGSRLWRHGAYVYVSAARRDWINDARGLLCAWIALVGFSAIAAPLYRTEEVIGFSVFLAPATVLATVAFLWSVLHERVIRMTRTTLPTSRASDLWPRSSSRICLVSPAAQQSGCSAFLFSCRVRHPAGVLAIGPCFIRSTDLYGPLNVPSSLTPAAMISGRSRSSAARCLSCA